VSAPWTIRTRAKYRGSTKRSKTPPTSVEKSRTTIEPFDKRSLSRRLGSTSTISRISTFTDAS